MKLIKLTKKCLNNHLDDFVAISKVCWREIGEEPWDKNYFISDYPGKWKYSRLIEDKGRVVAFLIGTTPKEYHGEKRIDNKKIGYINKLAVIPEYRGNKILFNKKSIAESLVHDFFNECKRNNLPEVRLSVLQNNIKAKRFWKKIGFIKMGERISKKNKKVNLMSIDL